MPKLMERSLPDLTDDERNRIAFAMSHAKAEGHELILYFAMVGMTLAEYLVTLPAEIKEAEKATANFRYHLQKDKFVNDSSWNKRKG